MNTPSATITALHDELRRLQIPAQIDAIDRGRVCTRGPVFYVVGDIDR